MPCCTRYSAPWPMLTVAITAPTPMMMPSMVSAERSLFRASARRANRSVFQKSILVDSGGVAQLFGVFVFVLRGGQRGQHVARDQPIAHGAVAAQLAVAELKRTLGVLRDVALVRHQHHR